MENAFSKHCVFKQKRSARIVFNRILLYSIVFPYCFWTWFLNLKKVSFPIRKHYFSQSGKRVQQTMVLDSPMEQDFAKSAVWTVDLSQKTNVCWTRFLNPRMLSFSMGKPAFLEFRNHDEKSFINPMKMEQNSVGIRFWHRLGRTFYNVCWTRFPEPGKASFPIGKPNNLQSGKRVQQTLVFQTKKAGPFTFAQNSAPFSLDL